MDDNSPSLWVIMPTYNEQESIQTVISEWLAVLRPKVRKFKLCVINDGSTDDTLSRLQAIQKAAPELLILDKKNSGHGPSCLLGYKTALENNSEWIFQIDSDGQCKPEYFAKFWDARINNSVSFGFRKKRGDGLFRIAVSRMLTVFLWVRTRIWIIDANVPYRLMHRDALSKIIHLVPNNFLYANILISILFSKTTKINWIEICFRQRLAGHSTLRLSTLFFSFIYLFKELRGLTR